MIIRKEILNLYHMRYDRKSYMRRMRVYYLVESCNVNEAFSRKAVEEGNGDVWGGVYEMLAR